MTLVDLIEKARIQLDDTIEPYKWGDDELFDYAKEATRIFITEVRPNKATFTVEVDEGTSAVSLGSSVINIITDTVKFNSITLMQIQFDELISMIERTGTPLYYAVNDFTIYLAPKPDADGVLTYTAHTSIPSDLTSASQILIPDSYHYRLVYGVMGFAYLKQDADTYDRQASEYMFSVFKDLIVNAKRDNERLNYSFVRSNIHRGLL